MRPCLKRAAIWLPQTVQTSAEIAGLSGIPQSVIEEKMGIVEKCVAPDDMHPSEMAIRAAQKVLVDEAPDSVDLIIWTGSEYKDHPVWSVGIFVQEQLGLRKAWSFDIAARCSSNVVGLKVACDMMRSDPKIKKVLLCGGHRTSNLVNYQDPNSRFLYNLSDGGSAILLEIGETNPILDASVRTDGRFSKDVIIPAGGTVQTTRSQPSQESTYLTVPDVAGMRERLADCSIENFIAVIDDVKGEGIDYLALLHMKRSASRAILKHFGLNWEQSLYMDRFGHFGAPDQVLSLCLAQKQNLIPQGGHVVLASAGIGYTWSALSLRWDHNVCIEDLY